MFFFVLATIWGEGIWRPWRPCGGTWKRWYVDQVEWDDDDDDDDYYYYYDDDVDVDVDVDDDRDQIRSNVCVWYCC